MKVDCPVRRAGESRMMYGRLKTTILCVTRWLEDSGGVFSSGGPEDSSCSFGSPGFEEKESSLNCVSCRRALVPCFLAAAFIVGPAEELLGEDNPCYRTMTFREFNRVYSAVNLGGRSMSQLTSRRFRNKI